MIPRNLLYLGIVAGGFCTMTASTFAAEQAATAAPAPAPAPTPAAAVTPAAPATAPLPSEFEDKEAFTAMGYMVSRQMRMNVGFSEQQIAWICEGFTSGANEAATPANYREDLHRAELIYRGHTQKMMEKQREEGNENMKLGEAFMENLPGKEKLTKTESGLYYEILAPGNPEKKPAGNDRVKVKYSGSFIDGTVFDQSAVPMEFAVSGVVPGFSEGLKLIGEGGRIRLYVPGNLGYGMQPPQNSPIKPGAMLIFDAEIDEVIKGAERPSGLLNPQANTAPDGIGKTPVRRAHRDNSMTPPPPPTTPPPPLPPEVLAQLKNPPKNPPQSMNAAQATASGDAAAAETKTDEAAATEAAK